MNIEQWAAKWQIPENAVNDLRAQLGIINTDPLPTETPRGESAIQSMVRLEASKKGLRLWRNNVGVALDENGVRCLRYGLCNDSERLNQVIKSSDLIGIRKVVITSAMVGSIIGQFVAREIKKEDWTYKATPRETAQLAFIELITSYGGDAQFANNEGTL